uniref:Uncharacterized protein n=1 Tax=Cannabis sativa TaxID=3483 RepID=A0A803NKC6_CANSA
MIEKVIDLVRDDTSRKDEEISITEKFSKKRQEINQSLSDLRVRRIKLNQLFESRCIPKRNLKEVIDIQKEQHVTIQKLLHAVEKEEHYWLVTLIKLVDEEKEERKSSQNQLWKDTISL